MILVSRYMRIEIPNDSHLDNILTNNYKPDLSKNPILH